MAIHASPGVYFETIDYSLYAPQLTKTTLALVGTTPKGPTEPTFISNVRQFMDTFGVPRLNDFSALSAISYLEYGSALWFRRVVGSKAKKALAEIPKTYMINDELLTTVDNTGQYIFSGTLNTVSVAGTVEIKIVDPNDPSNVIILSDSNDGTFSPYENKSISSYPNMIDYDTGDFRFTVSTVTEGHEVAIKYNYKEFSVVEELTKLITDVSVDRTYSGILKRGNVVDIDNFSLKLGSLAEGFVFTKTANGAETNEFILTGVNSASEVVGVGNLNSLTGEFDVTFNEGTNVLEGTSIRSTYKYCTFKLKTLGTVGEVNPNGGIFGKAYSGNLGTVVTPNSVSILMNDSVYSSDNGDGKFITGMESGTNEIDYQNKTYNFVLVTPPSEGFKIYASYMAKFAKTVAVKEEDVELGTSFSTQLDYFPVIKNSVIIKIGTTPSVLLEESNDGYLVGDGANGYVDYETGQVNLNMTQTLPTGEKIEVFYLAKMGEVSAVAEGDFYDNTKVEFYKDPFSGYGVRIWGPDQNNAQAPRENWKDINFTDANSTKYFLNKVASNLVKFDLYDGDLTAIPLLNTKFVLTGGDDDKSSISEASAINALEDFANAESFDINLIACSDYPGSKPVISKLLELCEIQRGDCFALIDPPQNLTVQQVTNWHNGDGQWANENALNSSFGALYYPWVQIYNQFSERLQWVPPSVKIVSVFAYNDSVAEVWNAPAGLNRGRIFSAQKVERPLNINDRDLLYSTGTNAVNPICDFVGDGIVVFGQKTLQRKPSALDRVNVRRMILYMSKVLATAVKYLLFEPNDRLTWTLYTQMVAPFVNDIKQRRGLYEFKVVCDETTNTPYDIDNNTMVAEIWLKPTKTAERIINRFIITSTGANLEELSTGN